MLRTSYFSPSALALENNKSKVDEWVQLTNESTLVAILRSSSLSPKEKNLKKWGGSFKKAANAAHDMDKMYLLSQLYEKKYSRELRNSEQNDLQVLNAVKKALPSAMLFDKKASELRTLNLRGVNELTKISYDQYFQAIIYDYNRLVLKSNRSEEENAQLEQIKQLLNEVPPSGFNAGSYQHTLQAKLAKGSPIEEIELKQYAQRLLFANYLTKLIEQNNKKDDTETRNENYSPITQAIGGDLFKKYFTNSKGLISFDTKNFSSLLEEVQTTDQLKKTEFDIREKFPPNFVFDPRFFQSAILISKADITFERIIFPRLGEAFSGGNPESILSKLESLKKEIDDAFKPAIQDKLQPFIDFLNNGFDFTKLSSTSPFTKDVRLDKLTGGYTLKTLYEDFNAERTRKNLLRFTVPTNLTNLSPKEKNELRTILKWLIEKQTKTLIKGFNNTFSSDVKNDPNMYQYARTVEAEVKKAISLTAEYMDWRDDSVTAAPDLARFFNDSKGDRENLFVEIKNRVITGERSVYHNVAAQMEEDFRHDKSLLVEAWREATPEMNEVQLVEKFYLGIAYHQVVSATEKLESTIKNSYVEQIEEMKQAPQKEMKQRSAFAIKAEAKVKSVMDKPELLLSHLAEQNKELEGYPASNSLVQKIYFQIYRDNPASINGKFTPLAQRRMESIRNALLELANSDSDKNFWEIMIQNELGIEQDKGELADAFSNRVTIELRAQYTTKVMEIIDEVKKNKNLLAHTTGMNDFQTKKTELERIKVGLGKPVQRDKQKAALEYIILIAALQDPPQNFLLNDVPDLITNNTVIWDYAIEHFLGVDPSDLSHRNNDINQVIANILNRVDFELGALLPNAKVHALNEEIKRIAEIKRNLNQEKTVKKYIKELESYKDAPKNLKGKSYDELLKHAAEELFEICEKDGFDKGEHEAEVIRRLEEELDKTHREKNGALNKLFLKHFPEEPVASKLDAFQWIGTASGVNSVTRVHIDELIANERSDEKDKQQLSWLLYNANSIPFSVAAKIEELIFKDKYNQLVKNKTSTLGFSTNKSIELQKKIENERNRRIELVRKSILEAFKTGDLENFYKHLAKELDGSSLTEEGTFLNITGAGVNRKAALKVEPLAKEAIDELLLHNRNSHASKVNCVLTKGAGERTIAESMLAISQLNESTNRDYFTDRERREFEARKLSESGTRLSGGTGLPTSHMPIIPTLKEVETLTRNTKTAGLIWDSNEKTVVQYTQTKTNKGEIAQLKIKPRLKNEKFDVWLKNLSEALEFYIKRGISGTNKKIYLSLNTFSKAEIELASAIVAFNDVFKTGYTLEGFQFRDVDLQTYKKASTAFEGMLAKRNEESVEKISSALTADEYQEEKRELHNLSSGK